MVEAPELASVEGLTRVGSGMRWVVLADAVQQFKQPDGARRERNVHREFGSPVRRVPDNVVIGGRRDRDVCAAVRRHVRAARKSTTAATAAAVTAARDRQQEWARRDDRLADGGVLCTAPPRHGDGRLPPHLVAGTALLHPTREFCQGTCQCDMNICATRHAARDL